jgi:hypothetical protein
MQRPQEAAMSKVAGEKEAKSCAPATTAWRVHDSGVCSFGIWALGTHDPANQLHATSLLYAYHIKYV